MFETGTLYLQFMPGNSSCGPGPMYGPGEKISLQPTSYRNEDGTTEDGCLATQVGNHVFVLRNAQGKYGLQKLWHTYRNVDGKHTYTLLPNNQEGGGYSYLRVVSLKTMLNEEVEEMENRERYKKLFAKRNQPRKPKKVKADPQTEK
jgi:hypothetical protein